MYEDIKKIIIENSNPVGDWTNPDGESIETEDRFLDEEDLDNTILAIIDYFNK